MSWQVDLFGKQFQTLKAATADLEQIGENFYGAQVTLAADVATAYVALRSAEAQLSVVQRSLGTRGETVQLTQWREQAGTGDALDTQRSISTLEQARASMPALQLSVVQSKNQLALLSGRTPGSLDSPLAGSRRVPEMISRIAAGVPAEVPPLYGQSPSPCASFILRARLRRQAFSPCSVLRNVTTKWSTPTSISGFISSSRSPTGSPA